MEIDFPRGKTGKTRNNYQNNINRRHVKKLTRKKIIDKKSDDQYINFVPGTSVLAVVSLVKNFKVYVCLPNNRKGIIAITQISDDYTKLLQDIASMDFTDLKTAPEKVLSLHDIFQPGMTLRCSIIEIDSKKNSMIKLSINPKTLTKDLDLKSVPVFTGIVSSCEDHGYILDIGQQNLSAFVDFKDSERYLKQLSKLNVAVPSEFSIGLYLNCLILNNKSTISKIIQTSIDLNKLKLPISSDKVPVSIQNILPGTILTVNVVEISESQLVVSCNNFLGSISRTHLLSNWKSYQVNQELVAILIYIHPIKRTLIFSELKHLSNFYQFDIFENMSIGDIMDNVQVVSIKKNYGAFLKIRGFTRIFAKWNQINATKNNLPNLKKDDLVKCRIVNLNFFDHIIFVSLRQDIIDQPYFKIEDIKIGNIITCQVQKSLSNGLVVSLFRNIRGFVPSTHISEILLKNPEKKFLPGKKIKCRVMFVDYDSQKIILTHKRLLIQPKNLIPFEYSDIEIGKLLTGFVGKTSEYGLVVVFFNNVKGWIPKSELSYQFLESPDKVFYVGQVINCLVKSYNAENDKLILTLKVANISDSKQDIFKLGSSIDCEITQQTNLGLYLKHNPSNNNAFIPLAHLSDYQTNCNMLLRLNESKSEITNSMIIENKNCSLTLTRKRSYIDMVQSENLITDIHLLIIDKLYFGFVKKKMNYGVFVQLSGLTGLVLKKDIIDVPHPDPISLLEEGQTIISKIKSIDFENKRFLATLRLKGTELNRLPIDYLEDFITENEYIRSKLLEKEEYTMLKKYSIGDKVKIKITSKTNIGILGVLNDGTSAFVINDNLNKTTCDINKSYNAVILYIDIVSKTLQLSLDDILLKAAKSYSKNKYTNVVPEQVIKSEVQFVNTDYILVSLRNHGIGQFAFVPARKHFSDVIEKFKFNIGQQNQVVIKRILDGGQILASLEIHEVSNKLQSLEMAKVGNILSATIREICDLQINIMAANFPGRIHITEIVDDLILNESNIISKYKMHDQLKVKVIEIRHDKLDQITLLECTIKPSKFNVPMKNWPVEPTIENLNIGDVIIGYITFIDDRGISLQISRKLKGFVNVLNISESVEVLNNMKNVFHIGTACKAWIMSKSKSCFQLTMIKNIIDPKIGDVVTAKILKNFDNHLFLQLPMNNIADTSFNDIIDIPDDIEFVACQIIKECFGPRKKFIVTLDIKKCIEKSHVKKMSDDIQVNTVSSSIEDSNVTANKSVNKNKRSNLIEANPADACDAFANHLILSSKFNWEDDDNHSVINIDDIDDQIDEPPVKKSKLISKIKKYESDLINNEKALHQDPNSSANWLKFISFELGNNEVDKARSIAERAIKTISFREENEKLNIWIAYMNLESNYGTEETLQKIVDRAKQSCDPFKIQCHLKDIFANAGRLEEAIDICRVLVKRHKHNLEAWSHFAALLYKFGKLQEARELLSDCLQRIEMKDRIEATSRFAQLESKFGVPERGETLLEDIIKNFPKRTDVWSMYVDMCIKNGHTDQARQVLERATNLTLNLKRMKFLFDKYLAFEAKFGNEETMRLVKEKAVKFAKK